jgi:hypothetical protein
MTDRRNVDALEGAIRDYLLALLDHRDGRIAAGETVLQAQTNLRAALRAVFELKEGVEP